MSDPTPIQFIPPNGDEFYVGYLGVPRGQRRFLRLVVPAILWAVLGAAALVALTQPDPGPAVWDDATPRTFTGVLLARPYPMLYADDRGDGKPDFLLLVEMGKRGAQRATAFDSQRVSVSGWILRRDGRLMLEMEPGEDALRAVPGAEAVPELPQIRPLGRVTQRGEIVDAKCFLGAMKPGHGKTHKECATLCISGGIPAMLVTRDAAGAPTYYLLMDPAGGPLDSAALPFIADPVEVSGELESQRDLLRLRVRVEDIRRL
ncbi:MAG: hypothetical protein ACKVU4_03370 [Phycisphaerales bacterium]